MPENAAWVITTEETEENCTRYVRLNGGRAEKQGVLTENLWPKLFSEAPRCAPLRLFLVEQAVCRP